jgi:hypothetical protein
MNMTPSLTKALLLSGLSLSIGWGIRGNFGHEYGAMIPGALAALGAILMSGRADWWRRAHYFAMFGAIGWSFGGSMSYMHVIAYTHSGHWPSQLYGFACLGVLGFVWGALGGAGTALPACLDRQRLTSLFPPMLAVFLAWMLQDSVVPYLERIGSAKHRHESILYWYDTDWIAALSALAAVLILAAVRRRFCWATSFILHLAGGWWVGFLLVVLLVDGLGIEFRMTPPRGDNWAGICGMTAGALVYLVRHRLKPVAWAALVCGFCGGMGFVAATGLKLVEVKYVPLVLGQVFGEGAWQTNWHSLLEQTYGFFNGVGVAVAMHALAARLPKVVDEPHRSRWTEAFAVAFVLLLVTYVNIVKNVPHWVNVKAVSDHLYGVPTLYWFNAEYAILAVAVIWLLRQHLRSPLAFIPESPLGKGQLLYLIFLWCVVLGNLMRAMPRFDEQRLITEGVIHLNAVLCTLMVSLWPQHTGWPQVATQAVSAPLRIVVGIGLVALTATVLVTFGSTRAIHGGQFIKHAGYHVRFGPDAKTGKPLKGQEHP